MSKGRILVVDDNPNLLELIRMRLESADFEVTATPDEEKAVTALREQPFDLCIVDLMLTNGDGLMLIAIAAYSVYTIFLRWKPPLDWRTLMAVPALGAMLTSLPILGVRSTISSCAEVSPMAISSLS